MDIELPPHRAIVRCGYTSSNLTSFVLLWYGHLLTSPLMVQTIFLCVWQAVHLNIPPPGERSLIQIRRRAGWSILAIIAPEMVALNAWLQYREARALLELVNEKRVLGPAPLPRTLPTQLVDFMWWLCGRLGMLCLFPILYLDRVRMLLLRPGSLFDFEHEQRSLRIIHTQSQLDSDRLPWTMDVAFYALSGGGVMLFDGQIKNLVSREFESLAQEDSRCLLPLQRAVLQDPSKASGLAKLITCAQAFWFCSQCIARLSQNMAISLLELNTFAHCISAFFIYVFWWHKPYDVATHTYIEPAIIPNALCTPNRIENMDGDMFSSYTWAKSGLFRPLIIVFTFLLYGAIHSLAWRYRFPTDAEGIMWRCASVATAASGLIVLLTIVRGWVNFGGVAYTVVHYIGYLLGFVAIVARSFLVVESFRALPNSPATIYEVPKWTAYIPHI